MRIFPWAGVGSGQFDWSRWEDLRFPTSGINPTGSANPPDVDGDAAGTFLFSGSSDEVAGLVVQMPHLWREGSEIRPHVHWAPTTAGAGNVYWRMQYKIWPYGTVLPGAWTSLNALAATPEVAEKHTITSLGHIDMTGYQASVVLLVTIGRPASTEATDTYNGVDARLIEFDIHYQINRMGTIEEFPGAP